jgi:hypothetical protein
MKLKSKLSTSQSSLQMYQEVAAREKLRGDQLQQKIDDMNAKAADNGKKKKKKKKKS